LWGWLVIPRADFSRWRMWIPSSIETKYEYVN
jgi:hypothetical protein